MENRAVLVRKDTPTQFPYAPPWLLISAPLVAACLQVKPETLNAWRIRGKAPEAVSTALIRPTQGNPLYYRLGQVKKWAAEQVGLPYSISDQILDFMQDFFPEGVVNYTPIGVLMGEFDARLEEDFRCIRNGKKPNWLPSSQVYDWDIYFSRQPRFVTSEGRSKYFDLEYALLLELPREHLSSFTPRQLRAQGRVTTSTEKT